MFGIKRPKPALKPVFFVPVQQAFKPQVEIHTHKAIAGWVNGKKGRARFSLDANKVYAVDEDKAREWVAKGYASYTDPRNDDISDDERAELQSQVTSLSLGA